MNRTASMSLVAVAALASMAGVTELAGIPVKDLDTKPEPNPRPETDSIEMSLDNMENEGAPLVPVTSVTGVPVVPEAEVVAPKETMVQVTVDQAMSGTAVVNVAEILENSAVAASKGGTTNIVQSGTTNVVQTSNGTQTVNPATKAKSLTPTADRIVVKKDEAPTQTPSGILLPETSKKETTTGIVVAAGPGRILGNGTKIPMEVKVGDRVMFSSYGGTPIELDNEKYLVLQESEVLAVLEGDRSS